MVFYPTKLLYERKEKKVLRTQITLYINFTTYNLNGILLHIKKNVSSKQKMTFHFW